MKKLKGKYTSFNDIFISEQLSSVLSRSDLDTTSFIGPLKLAIPVLSANMPAITGVEMAIAMAQEGGLGILPRFNSIEQAVGDYQKASSVCGYMVGVSIGVKPEDQDRFSALFEAGARIFCIDVAHGHHTLLRDMVQWIRNKYGAYTGPSIWNGELNTGPIIIGGNVATPEGIYDLKNWGCDIIKFGIGPGAACLTRKNTGVGLPQFGALEHAYNTLYNESHIFLPPIIADGGIQYTGDVAKALIFANGVMVAKMIAGSTETPGIAYDDRDGGEYKRFGGSASGEHKVANGNGNKHIEGYVMQVKVTGSVRKALRKIKEALQTAMSYTGVSNMEDYRDKVVYGEMTHNGSIESKL